MSSAIERLASELMKLPADEWVRLADHDRDVVFAPAWDEFSERLAPRELTPAPRTEQTNNESTPDDESHNGIGATGNP